MPKSLVAEIADLRSEVKARNSKFWKMVDRVDRVNWSNDWELWNALPEAARTAFDEGVEVYADDKASALAHFEASAALDNPVAMVLVGHLYASGTGAAPDMDRAIAFYRDALDAGSWNATIWYAREMDILGHHDVAIETLEDGIEADHIPSFFWLAWLRYKRHRTRKTARAVLPLIEYAMRYEHPGAMWLMGKLMMTGKLGLWRIPAGFRFAIRHGALLSVEDENCSGRPASDG